MHPVRYRFTCLAALAFVLTSAAASAQTRPLTDAEMEAFLRKARVVATKPIGIGVTKSVRATLTDGTRTHDAHIQVVDIYKPQFVSDKGTEFNFRDTWRYNVAAYRLDRMLDLRMVPVSVERRWNGTPAAFTWWVDDVMMDERKRLEKQMRAPNIGCWTQHAQTLRMFDALIENTDRNLGNTLISNTWRIWAIDHTRAFRRSPRPPDVADLTAIDRRVFERLAALDLPSLRKEIGRWVDDSELRKVLSRRDALLEHYRALGERALIDRVDPAAGCHVLHHNAENGETGGADSKGGR